jgi:hemerythrin superfamily protein
MANLRPNQESFMPTATSSAAKSKSSKSEASPGLTSTGRASMAGNDAVSLLMRDHREVEKLFKQYEKAKKSEAEKEKVFHQIHMELMIHTQIEEELVYPASREFVGDEETVNEAVVEHASAKDLIAQLNAMQPSDQYYDAKVMVLKEMIEHHVEEEETEFFPELRKSDMDLKGLAEQIAARKEELKAQMADGRGRGMH